jgi:hypothetical protein
MEVAKWMPRWVTRFLVRILKSSMRFSPETEHDLVLWSRLDVWQDYEAEERHRRTFLGE